MSLLGAQSQARTLASLEEQSRALAEKTEQEAERAKTRWNHAKELLGKYYQKSVVKAGEGISAIDDLVEKWTQKGLKSNWKKYSKKITQAILNESEHYGFDPVFLLAVIENESSFNPEARGPIGEIGLMQLTPQTAEWITKKYDLPWKGEKSLKDPVTNIKIGAAYLAYLREKFEFRSQLYLAAYNMGATNVYRALDKQIMPKDYSNRVMHRYVRFYTNLQKEVKKALD